MKWVDGGKAIFKVSTSVVSTVYTQVTLKYNSSNTACNVQRVVIQNLTVKFGLDLKRRQVK